MTTKSSVRLCYQMNGGYCKNKVSASNNYVFSGFSFRLNKRSIKAAPNSCGYSLTRATYITMATKQTTQLCYQINGGTCRNKVSAKNSYICAAGHRAVKGMSRDEIATQLPAEAIRKIGWRVQCKLATNPSIDREMAQALFDTEDERVRRDLATNPSIDREMIQALFDIGDHRTRHDLATNPSIDREMAQALFDIGDDWIIRALATNPSIDRDIAQALFDTGNNWIRRDLAENPSIDRDIQQALFNTGDNWTRCNLATNPSIDRDIAQALLEIEDEDMRRNLATNPSIARDIAQFLFDIGDWDLRYNLAINPSIDRDIAQALFDTGDHWIRHDLARNPSIDREMAIALAKDGHTPSGYLKNKSITELYSGENISLINEYPKEFGQAYLDHLLGSDEDLDQMKTLLCYSYDSYTKAGGYIPEHYKEQILAKYPNDKEVKILLS